MSLPFKVNTSSPVLVTGATGYVAGVLIQQLLDLGVTVHAAVRDPTKTDRLQHLVKLSEKSPGKILFFKGDLLEAGSYAEGMKGCSIVFHTASPFALDITDPAKDLVEPAVKGTENVLGTCNETPSVKRVILTSSCVAIYGDASDTNAAPGGVLTEAVWNRTSSLQNSPYSLSKTLAEQAAWVMAGSQTQWSMSTINPSFVMGPGTKYHAGSTSFQFCARMGNGEFGSGCPDFNWGVVDVRDVARAHIVAAYKDGGGVQGRYILNGCNTTVFAMGQALAAKYGADYPIPPRTLPKTLLWLLAPYIGLSRRYVSNNVGVAINLDNTKSKTDLGIEYHSLESTMTEMFEQLVQEGVFAAKNGDKKTA